MIIFWNDLSFIIEGLFTVRDFQLGYKNNVFRIKLTQKAKDAFTLMKVGFSLQYLTVLAMIMDL